MIQGTKEWLDFRKGKAGSSDAPVIMGVSPYKSYYQLWLEKTGRKEPTPINKFISDKGHTYEDLAHLDLEDHTEMYFKPEVFKSEENERWITSVDGYNEESSHIWECKYVGRDKYHNFINPLLSMRERVSEGYYPQVIHHCLVTGARHIRFTVVTDNMVFKSIEKGKLVFKHELFILSAEDIEYMNNVYKPELIKFTKLMEDDIEPLISPSEAMDIKDSKLSELLESYKKLNDLMSPLKKDIDVLKSKIFDIAMSYGPKISVDGALISATESKPKKNIDYELFVKNNIEKFEDIDLSPYEKYSNPRLTKRITFKQ